MGTFPTAGPFPSEEVAGLRTEVEIPFTETVRCGPESCVVPLDIVAPHEAEALPTIVLLQGGPRPFHERRNGPMIYALAHRGAVVFVSAYRSTETGNTPMHAYDDVRCAVRYAREHTANYGGDPGRVVVVGLSFGSKVALQMAVDPPVEPAICVAPGSGTPDAVVGLAGFGIQVREYSPEAPPMWLVAGSEDPRQTPDGRDDFADLEAAGFEVSFHELEGVTHDEMFDPAVTPEAVDLIFEAIDSLGG